MATGGVSGSRHLPHPAGAERADYFMWTELGTESEAHRCPAGVGCSLKGAGLPSMAHGAMNLTRWPPAAAHNRTTVVGGAVSGRGGQPEHAEPSRVDQPHRSG